MRSVRELVEAGEVYTVFQPIVDLTERVTFGYEALVRCSSEEFHEPHELIGAAVRDAFMGWLGREIRRMAVDHCPGCALFLNIHPAEFNEGWLVRPDDPLACHDEDVYLEITESVPLSHYRHCHSVLKEIRSKGIKLAVDDLGAGYSNVKYIADLEPEVVKIDRDLIAGITRNSRLHKLVTSIVDLCREQGAVVVAEGIETATEMRAVLDTGAQLGQGFFLARPAREPPVRDWAALLGAL